MKRWYGLRLLAAAAILVLGACAGSDDGSAPVEAGGGSDEGTGEGAELSEPGEGEATCGAPALAGSLETSDGTIALDAFTPELALEHGAEGCLTRVDLTLTRAGGACALELTLEAAGGAWSVVGSTIATAGNCELAPAESGPWSWSGGMAGLATSPVGDVACTDLAALSLVGELTYDGLKGGQHVVTFGDVLLSGGAPSAPTAEACPADLEPCAGLECGRDLGVECGGCSGALSCVDGVCDVALCPPTDPLGVATGYKITDLDLLDCDGNPITLHEELCGHQAAYMNLLAGW